MSMPIRTDAFLFDLDGTLADTRLDLAAAVNAALAASGRAPLAVETIAGYIGEGIETLLARALGTGDLAAIAPARAAFCTHYGEHCLDRTRLYPGVIETLDHFRGKAHAVVTNKPEDFARRILAGLGLDGQIAVLVGGGTAAALKPDPAPLRLALDRLGVRSERAVIVGDGLPDLEAGRRAGVRTCAVTYGLGDADSLAAARPDFVIGRFAELLDLFA